MIRGHPALFSLALVLALPVFALAQAPAKTMARKPKHESQAQLQKEAKVSLADAEATALKAVPNGKVAAHELERENGKLIYSFDFKVAGKSGIDEVAVDAITGAMLSKSHESPAAEAREAAADKKAMAKPPVKKP